jgi:diacylglycerol kinase family enzyme
MAVVDTYLHKFGVYCDVDVDGEDGEHHFAGDMMFCLAANGAYYGGSYYPAPKSYLDDGLLDFIVIDKVNRLFFLELVVQYTKGTYIKHEDIVHYHKGRRMTVRTRAPLGGNFDGEIFRIGTETTFEVVPGALRFIFVTDEHGDIMGARLKPQA